MSRDIEHIKIVMDLGDIIKIISPTNSDLHGKKYYINYIDSNKIKLIDIETNEFHELGLMQGYLSDETILSIKILNKSTERGYTRQNNLLFGTNISIRFSGEVPFVLNGKITNLEEDMIELSDYNTNKKFYIDFAYKGVPENLHIESIKLFTPPNKASMRNADGETNGETKGDTEDEIHEGDGEMHEGDGEIHEGDGEIHEGSYFANITAKDRKVVQLSIETPIEEIKGIRGCVKSVISVSVLPCSAKNPAIL